MGASGGPFCGCDGPSGGSGPSAPLEGCAGPSGGIGPKPWSGTAGTAGDEGEYDGPPADEGPRGGNCPIGPGEDGDDAGGGPRGGSGPSGPSGDDPCALIGDAFIGGAFIGGALSGGLICGPPTGLFPSDPIAGSGPSEGGALAPPIGEGDMGEDPEPPSELIGGIGP